MTYSKKKVVNLGGREVQLLFLGRGHTNGDTVVYLPKEKIVCTGDLMESPIAYMGDAQFDEWVATLEALKKLDFEPDLPGHGAPFTDKARITAFQGYLTDLVTQVREPSQAGHDGRRGRAAGRPHVVQGRLPADSGPGRRHPRRPAPVRVDGRRGEEVGITAHGASSSACVIAIAESHSFSKAARQLHVAQPPLSRHISQLERELGVKLFVRAASGVEFTREGALLLDQARTVIADTVGFLNLASRAKAGLVNPFASPWRPDLCEAVNRIRMHLIDRSPNLMIEGVDMASSAQHDALRRRTWTSACFAMRRRSDIQSEPLFAERFVVMVSESRPLAKCRSLQLKQLANERLLLQDATGRRSRTTRSWRSAAAAGVTPRIVTLEAIPGNQAAMLAVVSGEAICLALRGPISRSYQPRARRRGCTAR